MAPSDAGHASLQARSTFLNKSAEQHIELATADLHAPNVSFAQTCLNYRGPVSLAYPEDAAQHYREVHEALRHWLQTANHRPHEASGYAGPWIENVFISSFQPKAEAAIARGEPLSSVFGPFIPIFVPWVDLWVLSGMKYPTGPSPGLVATLLGVLRRNVSYVTVSQNAEGLTGKDELPMSKIPNVLVLSAGGYGHVAIPLLKQPETRLQAILPVNERRHLVNYVGKMTNAPDNFRARVKQVVSLVTAQLGTTSVGWGYVDDWRGTMRSSRASLAIRGYGRTSYHLCETIQLGLIPVHVFSDMPWVPYKSIFERDVGFLCGLDDLPRVLWDIHNASAEEIRRREARGAAMVTTHFSFEGAMDQIRKFLAAPATSDLECSPLPSTVRGAHR